MLKNEKKLIKELMAGSEEAFDLIYKEYSKLVYYIIYQIVENEDVANDLTNDTFLTMYNKIDQHKTEKSFKYWLLTIAKNKAKDYLRKNKEIYILNEELVMDKQDIKEDLKEFINRCISILNDEEKQIFNYYIVFNLTFKEIAHIMDKSKSDVHRKYKEIIEKIRKEYYYEEKTK